MTKLVLASVSMSYDIHKDRIRVIENYVPVDTEAEDYDENEYDLFCDGIVSYARRRRWMTSEDVERNKPLWKILGVQVLGETQ